MKLKNLLGERFGKLLVIERLPNKINGKAHFSYWKCQCDCGKLSNVRGNQLTSGLSKSCGCSKFKKPYESIYNKLVSISNRREIRCELTYNDFLEFTKIKECYYCGKEVKWHQHRVRGNSSGYNLDRLDNIKGYTKNNCVVCCISCNKMKLTFNKTDFLNHIQSIYDRHVGIYL